MTCVYGMVMNRCNLLVSESVMKHVSYEGGHSVSQ
jgi:hypothetical protein